jgi:hypothetical protein
MGTPRRTRHVSSIGDLHVGEIAGAVASMADTSGLVAIPQQEGKILAGSQLGLEAVLQLHEPLEVAQVVAHWN